MLKNDDDLFLAIFKDFSGILYQIQYADLNTDLAYLVEKTMSMCL